MSTVNESKRTSVADPSEFVKKVTDASIEASNEFMSTINQEGNSVIANFHMAVLCKNEEVQKALSEHVTNGDTIGKMIINGSTFGSVSIPAVVVEYMFNAILNGYVPIWMSAEQSKVDPNHTAPSEYTFPTYAQKVKFLEKTLEEYKSLAMLEDAENLMKSIRHSINESKEDTVN